MPIRTKSAARALFALLPLSLLSSCGKPPAPTGAQPTTGAVVRASVPEGEDSSGLSIRLSEGREIAQAAPSIEVPPATKLSEKETARLLARLPALAGEPEDEKTFSLRDRSQPPPRTGETERVPFPPAEAGAPAPSTKKSLEVVRFSPSGEVPIAPHVSVTFDQPMVAVTSHDDAVPAGVPLRIEPTPPGRFRWIGTRTLLFDPEVRLPMATKYRVTVPAGTRSASGTKLAREVRFEFSTPAPTLVEHHPAGGVQSLAPLVYLRFDQRVEPARVAATSSFRAGRERVSARLATEAEIAADREIAALVKAAEEDASRDRVAVLVPERALPFDAKVKLEVGPGTPSLEGPRTTEKTQGFDFETFGPLRALQHECGWGDECRPDQPFRVRFSNPLRPESLEGLVIEAEPALPRLRASTAGDWLVLEGPTEGRTRYRITIPAGLEDRFGQRLAEPVTVAFEVGDAYPSFFGPRGVVIVDPTSKRPTYDLHTVNVPSVDVSVHRVTLEDWPGFVALMNESHRKPVTPPGRRVRAKTIDVEGRPGALVETSIDLAEALEGGLGHAVVVVEPTKWNTDYKPKIVAWVQSTKLGLDAFVDDEEVLAWGTELATGRPLEGVEMTLAPSSAKATTDAAGLATMPLPTGALGADAMLVARKGKDTAFLPPNAHYFHGGGWARREGRRQLVWHVFDDRQMYRPSETVHVKGWVRVVDFGKGGDVEGAPTSARSVTWTLFGPRGNELRRGSAKLSALGGFDTEFDLPSTPNLGYARLVLKLPAERGLGGEVHEHVFQIQEFRRPEFEVEAQASEGPHLVGERATVTAEARYYATGALPGAPVHWRVSSSETSFTPPNRRDYVFGRYRPWWRIGGPGFGVPQRVEELEGETDARGAHVLALDFVSADPPLPASVVAEASVTDVNRQTWASRSTLLVHPSSLYVGLKRDRFFVEKGKPIEVEAIVVDHEGRAVPGQEAELTASRLEWRFQNGEYVEAETDAQRCALTSTESAGKCSFETPEGGTYKVKAIVRDDRGRPNLTELTVWVTGGKVPPKRTLEQEAVTLVPDGERYAPGDKAKLLVQAPFFPAEGLVTTRRGGLVSSRRFTLDGPTATVEIDIEEAHYPSLFVQVDLVGSAPRVDDEGKPIEGAPRRPAYAAGHIVLPVPPVTRALAVSATPAVTKLEPGGSTELTVEVKDHEGRPVKDAEVAIVVVDEAVLALSGYATPDPLATFHPDRGPGVSDHHARAMVQLESPEQIRAGLAADGGAPGAAPTRRALPASAPKAMEMAADMEEGASASSAGGQAPIAMRKDFDALALFEPEARTDASGRTKVRVKVPDNLTRYRVMAVAVAGEKLYGAGESSLTARMPLMVRPSAPRFLNYGDTFELPVVVQNQTDGPLEVSVGVRTSNLSLTAGGGRRVRVEPGDRVEVRFPAKAERAGTARFQVAASAGRSADAAEGSLPVYTPATTEAFATYGELDSGVATQPVAMPRGVIEEFGGLEVTTSSTQLQALTDAMLYLVEYPFECAEQVASRVLAVAALRDVLEAFEVEGMPSREELERAVRRDLTRLAGLQNADGGFSFWERGRESWPWITVHVASALVRADSKGFEIPSEVLRRALGYLATIEDRIPAYYPEPARHVIAAYALHTRAAAGQRDAAKAKALIDRVGHQKLGVEALGFLLGTLAGDASSTKHVAGIVRFLENQVSETAGTATFTTQYGDGAHLVLSSSRRADGVILEALVAAEQASDLVPKVVRGLLAHRVRGRWGNTQENAFVLLALDAYFQAFEKVTPNFVAKLWLGDGFAGAQTFRGRSTTSQLFEAPMRYVATHPSDVTLAKEGPGRLYYRIGMRYAPASLALGPSDHGFAVERVYEAVDDPEDVARMPDGTWKIKAGAKVRVRLTMVAESRRHHAALVDPLPAGLEPMNPALAVTGEIPQDPDAKGARPFWWWQRTWYEHQNMRDERVEAFASLLPAGVHEYTYVARATTPGRFVVPPVKAEEMYAPETFGRSSSDVVVVAAAAGASTRDE